MQLAAPQITTPPWRFNAVLPVVAGPFNSKEPEPRLKKPRFPTLSGPLMVRSTTALFVPESICMDMPYPDEIIWMFASMAEPEAAAVHQRPLPLMSKVPMPASPEPYCRRVVGAD